VSELLSVYSGFVSAGHGLLPLPSLSQSQTGDSAVKLEVYSVKCPECKGLRYVGSNLLCPICNGVGVLVIAEAPKLNRTNLRNALIAVAMLLGIIWWAALR
jgi:hypothetical protein